jgi:thiol-disulfide isomerase/thioredoxin
MTKSMRFAVPIVTFLGIGTVVLLAFNAPSTRPKEPSEVEYKAWLGRPLMELRRRIGSPSPDLAFRLLSDDSQHRLQEFRGRVVLLNVWETSCGPCLAEMPGLNNLQREYGQHRLAIITLTDEFREPVLRFAERKPLALPPLSAYTKRFDWIPKVVFPLKIFIDRDGVIRELIVGKRSEQEFEVGIQRYL